MSRTMMVVLAAPINDTWADVLNFANLIQERLVTRTRLVNNTSYEINYGKRFQFLFLRVF